MLGRCDPGRPGLLVAPTFEVPHSRSQGEQASVDVIRRFHSTARSSKYRLAYCGHARVAMFTSARVKIARMTELA